jgi:hypothetical protein
MRRINCNSTTAFKDISGTKRQEQTSERNYKYSINAMAESRVHLAEIGNRTQKEEQIDMKVPNVVQYGGQRKEGQTPAAA